MVISAGSNSPTVFYSVPGGISISQGPPGASYVLSTYPGLVSNTFRSSSSRGADHYDNVNPASFSSSSSSSANPPSTKENNYSTFYSDQNPFVSISTGGTNSSSIINTVGADGPAAVARINGYYGNLALAEAQRSLQGASQLISRIASSLRL